MIFSQKGSGVQGYIENGPAGVGMGLTFFTTRAGRLSLGFERCDEVEK